MHLHIDRHGTILSQNQIKDLLRGVALHPRHIGSILFLPSFLPSLSYKRNNRSIILSRDHRFPPKLNNATPSSYSHPRTNRMSAPNPWSMPASTKPTKPPRTDAYTTEALAAYNGSSTKSGVPILVAVKGAPHSRSVSNSDPRDPELTVNRASRGCI